MSLEDKTSCEKLSTWEKVGKQWNKLVVDLIK